jgi:signal transduction histidine kinase
MDERPIGDSAASRQDFPIVIASMPASAQERRLSYGLITLLCAILAIVAPFANVQLGRIDAFVPTVQTVMCVVDLITAALLFAMYSVLPKPALLALASGYVFTALFAFIQTLAFPGAYSAKGLIGDGTNSPAWLFVLWHTSFSLSVIVYALLKDVDEPARVSRTSAAVTIAFALACIVAVTAALTWVVTAGVGYLPTTYQGITQQTSFARNLNVFLWSLSVVAFVLLLVRRRTVLDTWLIVILIAWWPNFLVAIFLTSVRFSLGWYAARCFALVASSTLLIVLLAETTVLYARLANAFLLLRRERNNRFMSIEAATGAMAHEIRQPLSVMASSGEAGLKWISRKPPQLNEVTECLTWVVDASHRANEIIESIRRLFARVTPGQRTMQQINDIVLETLTLVQHDLQVDGISVTTEYRDDLPQIHADRMQIQQVILNLIKNAIEATRSSPDGKRHLRVVTGLNGNSDISVSIRDTGPGIGAKDRDSIFDPFFTTKATGTGLGLSICRTIIENHGGKLRLTETDFRGSIFEVAFPVGSTSDSGS